MSNDEREFAMCEYCEDERGLCDRPHLVEGRRFSIKLQETHHGYDFAVNLYNFVNSTNFGCLNWEALCKAYDFHEGMLLTFDLGDTDIDENDMTIWVLVDTLPVLPLCEFLKHIC